MLVPTRQILLGAALVALCTTASHVGATPLYPLDAGRVEAELELVVVPWDAGPELDELDPIVLFGVMGGVQLGHGLRAQLGLRGDVTDPEADHVEVVAGLGWTWVQPTPLDVPPALRVGARLELGWRWLELTGSDFILSDDGLTGALSTEVGLVVFERFALVARVGAALVSGSNGALPDLQVQLRTGVAFVGAF
ncbi:MAG: hypothetical protein IT385_30045 [Deltaproteobacteria bacterium]|nr:hypothetical protein [Deltaproteobacteria bacterium]